MILYNLPPVHNLQAVDGDTLIVWLQFGDTVRIRERVRLIGVECGELGSPNGDHGHACLSAVLHQRKDMPAFLTHSPNSRDRYGRIVSDIKFADAQLLTLLLLAGGAHWKWSGRSNDPRRAGPPAG